MNDEELKKQIKSIQLDEIGRFFERIWDSDPETHNGYDVPNQIDPSKHTIADIIDFEKKRVMNLGQKANYHYYVGHGWERSSFCDCGADHYYECSCEPDKKQNRMAYVKRKKEELFGINSKLTTLMALRWKLSGIDQVSTISDNILQAEDEFPLLRKKIAQATGKAVQNFESDNSQKSDSEVETNND